MTGTQRTASSGRRAACAAWIFATVIAIGGGQALGQVSLPVFGNIGGVNAADAFDSGEDTNPRMATDGAGNVVAVWQSNESATGLPGIDLGTDLDLGVASSSDGGATLE
ncbi:MAG: hypothetical protein ACYSUQ_02705 [Planctomycetota bacterium]